MSRLKENLNSNENSHRNYVLYCDDDIEMQECELYNLHRYKPTEKNYNECQPSALYESVQ